jgi:hypothetical protein
LCQIALKKVESFAFSGALKVAQLLGACVIVAQAVNTNHFGSVAEERLNEVGANEAGAAGYDAAHRQTVSTLITSGMVRGWAQRIRGDAPSRYGEPLPLEGLAGGHKGFAL